MVKSRLFKILTKKNDAKVVLVTFFLIFVLKLNLKHIEIMQLTEQLLDSLKPLRSINGAGVRKWYYLYEIYGMKTKFFISNLNSSFTVNLEQQDLNGRWMPQILLGKVSELKDLSTLFFSLTRGERLTDKRKFYTSLDRKNLVYDFKSEIWEDNSITNKYIGLFQSTMELFVNEDKTPKSILWIIEGIERETLIGIESENNLITGYDGLYELPKEALELLEYAGYKICPHLKENLEIE